MYVPTGYIHVFIHKHIHTYIHTYMHTNIHICTHGYIKKYWFTCLHACIHLCTIHTCNPLEAQSQRSGRLEGWTWYLHTYEPTYIHTETYNHTNWLTHTYMYACTGNEPQGSGMRPAWRYVYHTYIQTNKRTNTHKHTYIHTDWHVQTYLRASVTNLRVQRCGRLTGWWRPSRYQCVICISLR